MHAVATRGKDFEAIRRPSSYSTVLYGCTLFEVLAIGFLGKSLADEMIFCSIRDVANIGTQVRQFYYNDILIDAQ